MKQHININKLIHKEVDYALSEIDIDHIVKQATNSKAVKKFVELAIKDKIATTIGDKIMEAYQKNERIIDAWAENKVRNLLIELGLKQ